MIVRLRVWNAAARLVQEFGGFLVAHSVLVRIDTVKGLKLSHGVTGCLIIFSGSICAAEIGKSRE